MANRCKREIRKGWSKGTAWHAMCFLPTLRIPRRRWTEDGFKRYQIHPCDTTTERFAAVINARLDDPSSAPRRPAQ
jgi:hypothetical protein